MALKIREMGPRALSALILAPFAVAAAWLGGLWILAVMLVAIVLLALEWARMSAREGWRPVAAAVATALAITLLLVHFAGLSPALIMLVFGGAAAGLFVRRLGRSGIDAAYGVLYIGWPALLFIWLRDGTSAVGFYWITLAFVVSWSADVAAFLVGSAVGGPKLWPRFSPNKTWSGFVGGLIAGTLAGMAMSALPEAGAPNLAWGALLGVSGALATMAGDLWESALKRRFGVKDAGSLIPGHGGLLDRVDGLMFCIVAIAIGRALVINFGGGA